jgi:hypothetical protein
MTDYYVMKVALDEPLKEIEMIKERIYAERVHFEQYVSSHNDQHLQLDKLIQNVTNTTK